MIRPLSLSFYVATLGSLALNVPMIARADAPPEATGPGANATKTIPDDMQVEIKGEFKGRFLVKKIVAPVTMNLEKLQDFPEDPSQKILMTPLPISLGQEFNARAEVRGHAPFVPWIPAIPEPPFLRLTPPKLPAPPTSWTFEVFNPQGQTIYRQRGTNAMPDELIWEGKDSENKFAIVDRLYSAQLTITGADDKSTIIQGESVILPAMAYGSDESETIEFALNRIFAAGKSDITAEGVVMLSKLAERLRERGLQKMHVRISSDQDDLAGQRETALVTTLQHNLHLLPGQIEHDHTKTTLRGEIAVFWLKTGGSPS